MASQELPTSEYKQLLGVLQSLVENFSLRQQERVRVASLLGVACLS